MTTSYCGQCRYPCVAITSKPRTPAEFCMYQGISKGRAGWLEVGDKPRRPLFCVCKQCEDRKCRVIIHDEVKMPNACPWEHNRFVDWKAIRAKYEAVDE